MSPIVTVSLSSSIPEIKVITQFFQIGIDQLVESVRWYVNAGTAQVCLEYGCHHGEIVRTKHPKRTIRIKKALIGKCGAEN